MEAKKLYRSRSSKWIAGVCGGLGKFFNMDPTFWRLIFIFGGMFGCPFFVLAYIILWIIAPKEIPVE